MHRKQARSQPKATALAALLLSCASVTAQTTALRFDGTNDFVSLSSSAQVIQRTNWTIEAWVRINTITSTSTIYSECTSAGPNLYFWIDTNRSLGVSRQNASAGTWVSATTSAQAIPAGAWTHVAATFDQTIGARLYINGVASGSNTDTRAYTTTSLISNTALGATSSTSVLPAPGYQNFFAGDITDLRLWSTTRTQANIQANLTAGSVAPSATGLVALWPINEGGGQTLRELVATRTAYLGSTNLVDVNDPTWLPGGPTAEITYASVQQVSAPLGIANHSMAPLPSGGHLLFGGSTTSITQVLNGNTWTTQFPVLNPAARSNASMCLDIARTNNVLFGGVNPGGAALNDTWVFANGQWSYLTPATAPSARSEHRMAYEASQQRTVLFGGKNNSGAPLGDQWIWNGTTWAQSTPPALPTARYGHGMAYDDARSRIVLFAGQDASGYRDDLWEWDGTNWSLIPPVQRNGAPWRPDARARHGFAYDAASERVVLHGGANLVGCLGDAWSWDGTDWLMHLLPSTAPSARSGEQLVEDPSNRRLLLSGGGCGSTTTNDLWKVSVPVAAKFIPFGTGCAPLSGGAPTLTQVPTTSPRLGQTLGVRVGNLPQLITVTVPFFGFSRTEWSGQPLPLNLANYGMPGCTLDAQLFTNSVAIGFVGYADWSLSIPNIPDFAGLNLYFQAFVALNNSGNAAGGVMTNAARVILGN